MLVDSPLPFSGLCDVLYSLTELDWCSRSCHMSAHDDEHHGIFAGAKPPFSLRHPESRRSIINSSRRVFDHQRRMSGSHYRETYHFAEDECDITCAIAAFFTTWLQLQTSSNTFSRTHGLRNHDLPPIYRQQLVVTSRSVRRTVSA
jgi:hypothetical protein